MRCPWRRCWPPFKPQSNSWKKLNAIEQPMNLKKTFLLTLEVEIESDNEVGINDAVTTLLLHAPKVNSASAFLGGHWIMKTTNAPGTVKEKRA